MAEEETVAVLLADIEADQERLRAMLAAKDEAAMATRPPSGKWSVTENVRHLAVAEHWHLGRFIPKGAAWSPSAVPAEVAQQQKRLRMVGSDGMSVAEALEMWRAIHAATREHVERDTEPIRKALWTNRRHLRAHLEIIERLLRAQARSAGGAGVV